MKKLWIGALALGILLSGCVAKKPVETTPGTMGEGDLPALTEAAPGVVTPLPAAIDVENLSDCTVSVGLEEGDAYLDDTGVMGMHLSVYTYELFDMVDIARLQIGDYLMLHGEAVAVSQLEKLESGAVRINGGQELGGYELWQADDTCYYEVGPNDGKVWLFAGTVDLPVSEDFLLTDASNLDTGVLTFYPGDFLVNDPGILYPFGPGSTTVTVEGGMITAMERVYTP